LNTAKLPLARTANRANLYPTPCVYRKITAGNCLKVHLPDGHAADRCINSYLLGFSDSHLLPCQCNKVISWHRTRIV